MATQTQYPIRNIRGADELYGKKICKFKWEGGSFYAPMIQTTQLQRTAVVIEHSTVTDMPIAQYGLCKSPTVSLSLFLTDAVPYKTSQLTYNVNDVTAKRIINDLNTVYEKHLPFSITIPQAFTDYLHDLVITSLNFQVSADKRFVVQADIAATSVNVVKLGYQQGAVATEIETQQNNSGDLRVSNLDSKDEIVANLNEAAEFNDSASGIMGFVPYKYRKELYDFVSSDYVMGASVAGYGAWMLKNMIGEDDYKDLAQSTLGISDTSRVSDNISEGKIGVESSFYADPSIMPPVYDQRGRDWNKKEDTTTLVSTSYVTDTNGNLIENKTNVKLTNDYTNVDVVSVDTGYTNGFLRSLSDVIPGGSDSQEYMRNIAVNMHNAEYANKTPYEFDKLVQQKKNDGAVYNVDDVLKNTSHEFYKKTGIKPGEATQEDVIRYSWDNGKVPLDKKGNPMLLDYSKAVTKAEVIGDDGKVIGEVSMPMLAGESTSSEVGSHQMWVDNGYGPVLADINGTQMKIVTDASGRQQIILYGPEYNSIIDNAVGEIDRSKM